MENCSRKNITIPLIPGIFPIRDIDQTVLFAKRCGASVPEEVVRKLSKHKNDISSFNELSADMTSELKNNGSRAEMASPLEFKLRVLI